MYSWPEYCLEVCSIFTLGKQPSVWECEIVAKAQEIMAWLPMIDAASARMNVGQNKETACVRPSGYTYKHLVKNNSENLYTYGEIPSGGGVLYLLGVDL